MKQVLIILFSVLISLKTSGQIKDIFTPEVITNPLHQANIGRITFMASNIPLNVYKEEDFLSTFELSRKNSLNIRVFMANSVTNYIHQLAPELSIDELLKSGNLQFSFFVDGNPIYQENIHHGCNFGSSVNKNTVTTFRVPLTSTTGEGWWAMYMWDRFKLNGGDKALTEGKHQLKIVLKPYVRLSDNDLRVGEIIAQGQIELVIKTPVITKEEIAIQPIAPNSDWEISKAKYDTKKIEALNTAIAKYELKDITSIVVIKDHKLLLEEYFNDANRSTLHDPRSAGKSFTSTMMGIAIKDRYINNEDQPLKEFYDLKKFANYAESKEQVTIKNLLMMSSAFEGSDADGDSPGNEENMYPTDNWVKFTLDLPMDARKKNGVQWDYFTAGVVLMGDILHKTVPEGLEKYTDKKLFKPLNITKYQWQYTPQNVVNTAGSLQMRAIDYAKYAQLYKNNGQWHGKQIIPADWVAKTLTKQIQIPERENEYYSYLFWNKTFQVAGKNYEAFYCAGNGGNQFIIFKDLPIVIIITAKAYNKPYAHPQSDTIVREYVLPAVLK